jgi:hypothetical protein
VDTTNPHDEQALRTQLKQARETLDGLVRNLRSVDAEIEGLSGQRRQHDLLEQACNALEELSSLGGAELFWGARTPAEERLAHVRHARSHVDAFEKQIGEIEERRQALLEEVERQQRATEWIEDDVFELQQREEQRKLEWIPEREMGALPFHELVMPWTRRGEEDDRFRKTLATSLLIALLLALLVPWINLPLPELQEGPIEVPERLARLIVEPRPLPPPPVQKEKAPEATPSKEVAETPPQTSKQKPNQGPGEGPGTGPGKGILAFRDALSGFAQNQALSRLGAQAHIRQGAAPSGTVERSMVAIQAPGSSGGINLSDLSRGVYAAGGGGGSIQGVQIARATSTIPSGGGGRASGSGSGHGVAPGRTDEEIQIVFDRYKSSLYRIYNRELRSDPTLKGQMVLRIRIEPDGSVTLCELHSTDMKAPQLVAQVLDRVRTFDFGAKEVPAITILYPIDFLPAT